MTHFRKYDGLKNYFADAGHLYRPGKSRLLVKEWNNVLGENNPTAIDRIKQIKQRLIENHQLLIIKRANYFSGRYNVSLEDLIGEGNIGLMKAMEKFNPALGYQLIAYAKSWINLYMLKYCLKELRSVAPLSNDEDAVLEFDQKHHKSMKEIEEEAVRLVELERMKTALAEIKLSPRDRKILELRYFSESEKTLEEIATIVGLSREGVSQILDKIIAKLRRETKN